MIDFSHGIFNYCRFVRSTTQSMRRDDGIPLSNYLGNLTWEVGNNLFYCI